MESTANATDAAKYFKGDRGQPPVHIEDRLLQDGEQLDLKLLHVRQIVRGYLNQDTNLRMQDVDRITEAVCAELDGKEFVTRGKLHLLIRQHSQPEKAEEEFDSTIAYAIAYLNTVLRAICTRPRRMPR